MYWTVFRMLWKALAFSGVFKETRLYLSQIVPPLAQRRMRDLGSQLFINDPSQGTCRRELENLDCIPG